MNERRSLDDTCDIFLSRRRRSPLANQHVASTFSHYSPTLRPENVEIAPFIRIPSPPDIPDLSTTITSTRASTKPLPLPGSSGVLQPKPTRLANGRSHIPRPRNPFILFRCDLVHQRKVLPRSDLDDTNISRIAGDLWREMTALQKKPWVDLAAQEKARHALLYPDYKYAPGHTSSKTKKAKSDNAHQEDSRTPRQISHMDTPSPFDHSNSRRQPERPRPYPRSMPRRRSLSCPPAGAVEAHPRLEAYTPTLVSKDDIQRRPSLTKMYHSKTPLSVAEPTPQVVPRGHDPLLSTQGLGWPGFAQIPPLQLDPTNTYPLSELSLDPESYAAADYAFFDFKPTFVPGPADPGLSIDELNEIEHLAIETTFTDPFYNMATVPTDNHFPYAFSTAMPPLDCSGYSTGSISSPSTETVSPN